VRPRAFDRERTECVTRQIDPKGDRFAPAREHAPDQVPDAEFVRRLEKIDQ